MLLMVKDNNVIYHTPQAEISHSRNSHDASKYLRMAGLNPRAVKDIEEGRAQSPKLATVFALSKALGEDPGEMIGLGPRYTIKKELAAFLAQYDEADQARLLAALEALAP